MAAIAIAEITLITPAAMYSAIGASSGVGDGDDVGEGDGETVGVGVGVGVVDCESLGVGEGVGVGACMLILLIAYFFNQARQVATCLFSLMHNKFV